MSRYTIAALFVSVVGLPGSADLAADDLIGAESALERIRQSAEQVKERLTKVEEGKTANKLRSSLEAFRAERDKLSAADAAAQWLKLYDAWDRLTGETDIEFSELIDSLPPPDAWNELSRQIQLRQKADGGMPVRHHALRMLGLRLAGRYELLSAEIDTVHKLVAPDPAADGAGDRPFVDPDDWARHQLVESLNELQASYDPDARVANFIRQLEGSGDRYLMIPDLVSLVGRQRASELLQQALVQEDAVLHFGRSAATLELARKIAREKLGQISVPHWQLCEALGTADLYEAFAELPPHEYGSGNEEATAWYVINLIVDGRSKDLVKFLEAQPRAEREEYNPLVYLLQRQLIGTLDRGGHATKVYDFLAEALQTSPDLPLWEAFVPVAARLGRSDQMLAILEKVLGRDSLSDQLRSDLRKIRADALLADDKVDEGVRELIGLLDEDSPEQDAESRFQMALRLAELGRLLENQSYIDKGLDVAFGTLADPDSSDADLSVVQLASLLNDLGRHAQAEELLIEQLARSLAHAETQDDAVFSPYFEKSLFRSPLASLLSTYHAADRYADVVALLEQAPWWGAGDLAELSASSYRSAMYHTASAPIAYMAAKALAETGRRDEARRICESLVFEMPGYDPAWQLALELTGDDFEQLAEEVFRRDRFEERPLIWRAQFELNRGNVQQAGELVSEAISIDPSDGEQGRGHRMRAYAILSEVLRKQGDKSKADLFAGAVRAIRLAERADQFYAAGLLSRGIQMYKESLDLFDDAYCIQSRLATQLAMRGDLDSAAKHYERAFELMPSSFGRVESHCFGCEGVFQGQIAQEIAGRVFQRLVEKSPDDPRVHYLLGYLYYEQGRYEDAVQPFSEAVRLDPDYLNAWKKLQTLADHVELPPSKTDEAVLNILRLDPSGEHSQAEISQVSDLAKLWKLVQAQGELQAPIERNELFTLKASAEKHDKTEHAHVRHYYGESVDENRSTFAGHGDLAAITTLIESAR